MRERIEARLATYAPRRGRDAGLLANLDGPMSVELRDILASPGKQAAVLIGLVERSQGLAVVLTERARHLQNHAGQVAFPGGRIEHARESAVDAALREASEEIGLAPSDVEIVCSLAEHATGTGFIITPVVGFIAGNFVPVPDPGEVREVFEVPLEFVLEPDNYTLSLRRRFGSRFRSYEMHYAGHVIWGATAAMLVTFRDIIINNHL